MAKVKITDTILRDAHQSQAATRMRLDEMLPACEKLDKVGYYSLEVWGGATFDSCLRFLNEDPWERLRALRKALPNTKLQMLLRGQNILGYKHYADDVVDLFVKKSLDNGIDIIRIFDALNDLRNMETAVKATKKYNGIAEVSMSYTISRCTPRNTSLIWPSRWNPWARTSFASRIWPTCCCRIRRIRWSKSSRKKSKYPSYCTRTTPRALVT